MLFVVVAMPRVYSDLVAAGGDGSGSGEKRFENWGYPLHFWRKKKLLNETTDYVPTIGLWYIDMYI